MSKNYLVITKITSENHAPKIFVEEFWTIDDAIEYRNLSKFATRHSTNKIEIKLYEATEI